MLTVEMPGDILRVVCGTGEGGGVYVRNPESWPCRRLAQGCEVRFMREGRPVLTQSGWALHPRALQALDASKSTFRMERTVDGERAILKEAQATDAGETNRGFIRFACGPDEVLYGLGQHEKGVLNRRMDSEYLYQNNMKIPMPVLLSSAGWGLLFNHGCPMRYSADADGFTLALEAADAIEFYLFTAASFDGLSRRLHALLGPAALLPRWALGYVQSRERYKTQDEILQTARRFAALDIPLDCIVLDWLSWEEGKWGNKRVDKARFPDLSAMTEALHAMGVAFMISVWPNINRKGEDHAEMRDSGFLLADLNTYNAFDPAARDLYWRQCMRELAPGGVDAWWCDSTEPFTPDWNGPVKLPAEDRYNVTVEKTTLYMDARRANDFALYHARGIYEHQRRDVPQKRVVNLTRSGSPSIGRYGAILWSGDIKAGWADMRAQIAEGLNMAMSGQPYWTVDIGAFFVGGAESWAKWSGRDALSPGEEGPWFWRGAYPKGVEEEAYRELYVRWLQWAAFLPVMRSHGTDTPREPWQFGGVGSAWYEAIVKYIRLRKSMQAMVYSLAARAALRGIPMMRPMAAVFEDGAKAPDSQYMFGDALLVCPVTRPGGAVSAYLPVCSGWYPLGHDSGRMNGGIAVEGAAPLDEMPVYVRAGGILAMEDAQVIEVYAGADGAFDLYLDAGDGYGYEDGAYAWLRFEWDDAQRALTARVTGGGLAVTRTFAIRLHETDGRVSEAALEAQGGKNTLHLKR